MVELADGQLDDAPSDDGNGKVDPSTNQVVVPTANPTASSSSAARQAQLVQLQELEAKLKEEHRQSRSCVPHSSGSSPHAVPVLGRRGVSPRSESWPTTTSTTHWT